MFNQHINKMLLIELGQLIVYLILTFLIAFILGYFQGMIENEKVIEKLKEDIKIWKSKVRNLIKGI